jgi:hypothetical protein
VFQYDELGNLRQRQMGMRMIVLRYDANNRLSSHTDTAGSPRPRLIVDESEIVPRDLLHILLHNSQYPIIYYCYYTAH